jgi:hypothetical protein
MIFCPGRTVFVCTVFLSDMPFDKCGMDGRMDGWMDGQTSIYSKLPSNPAWMGNGVCHLHEKSLTETRYKVKTACFHFTSCIGVILSGTEDLWVMWSHIHVASTALIPAWGRSMSSTAKDSWENYHVAGEHMHVADLNVTDLPSNSKSMKRAERRRLWCRIHTYSTHIRTYIRSGPNCWPLHCNLYWSVVMQETLKIIPLVVSSVSKVRR